ncbi:MAG TPA: hypothetical protein VK145_01700, partial [Candidatus Nanoarchaeia archaeon]|nr:hypothetical protein [Candidatus Nanoarchaeia archaeon]
EAVKMLEARVKVAPNDPALRIRLAAGYLSIGQRAKSIATLQEIGKLFPDTQKEIDYYIKEIQAGRDPTKAQ